MTDDPASVELPIEADVGIAIDAHEWQAGAAMTSAHPFVLTGPQNVIDFLRNELPIPVTLSGYLSPPNKITIKGERARRAGIPQNAAFYCFAYPLESLNGQHDRLMTQHGEPWLYFLLLGGFCYFDAERVLLQTNALVLSPTERKLTLAGPFQPSSLAVAALQSASRMRAVTLTQLRDQGFQQFAWLNPAERPGDHPVLADAAEPPQNNGAFLYLLAGEVDAVVYFVIPRAPAVSEGRRGSLKAHAIAEPHGAVAGVTDERPETIHSALGRLSRGHIDAATASWRNGKAASMNPRHNKNSARRNKAPSSKHRGNSVEHEELAWTGFIPRVVQQQLTESKDLSESIGGIDAGTSTADGLGLPPPRRMLAAAIFADASGFTALTERLWKLPDGAERMCDIMNSFLGQAINIVHAHGGQILKFAGDALSAVFIVSEGEMGSLSLAVEAATRCCFEMHKRLHGFVAWRPTGDSALGDATLGDTGSAAATAPPSTNASAQIITLSLHIGVGCGELALMHLGGHQSRREFVAAGTAISEAAIAEPYGASGETVASAAVWALLQAANVCTARPLIGPSEITSIDDAIAHQFKLGDLIHDARRTPTPLPSESREDFMRASQMLLLRSYVPRAVTLRLAEGVGGGNEPPSPNSFSHGDPSLSEIRQVSNMAINR